MKKKKRIAMSLMVVVMFVSFVASNIGAAAATAETYDQYLADYLISSSEAQSYIRRDYYLPYRKYVEDRKNSAAYQGLLTAWEVATFSGSAASKANKAVAYYETILYDSIIGDITSCAPIVNTLDSTFSSIKASTYKTIFDYCESLDEFALVDLVELEDISLDDPLFNKLVKELAICENLKESFKLLDTATDVIGDAKTIVEVIDRVSALEALTENKIQMQKVLTDINASTSDSALAAASLKMITVLDETYSSDAVIKGILAGEGLVKIVDKASGAVWDMVLETAVGAGLTVAVKTGQKLGKLGAGILFSTDEDVECVYSMNALYEIEDQTVKLVKQYESKYKSSPTDSNAKLYNEAFKQLMRIYMQGVDYSLKYGEITHEKGLINQFFKSFESEDYKEYVRVLNMLKESYQSYLDYIDVGVYNNYLAGIPNTKSYYNQIKKKITIKKTSSVTSDDVADFLRINDTVSTLYTNHTVNDGWTLTEDYTTYGNLIIKNSINLDGKSLTVYGDVIQSYGTVTINNGTFNVFGNYSMEDTTVNNIGEVEYNFCYAVLSMENQHDKVNITGNFTTHKINSYDKVTLKYGTLSVGGNIWSDGGIYSPSGYGSKVVLNGTGDQSVYLSNDSGFNELEMTNPNKRIITWSGNLKINKLVSDIRIIAKDLNLSSLDLNRYNMIIDGDAEMDGEIDLNGGTLTINGNLLQKSGKVSCNNGLLNIRGNYSMENTTVNNIGEVEYNSCNAELSMLNQHDKVNITGNFTTHNIRNTYYVNLIYGTLSVGGNIWSDGNIYSSSGYGSKVVLNGTGDQSVYLSNDSGFNELEMTNPNKRSITWSGNLKINKLASDIRIIAKDLNLSSLDLNRYNMIIDGDAEMDGIIDLNGGTLTINGNLLQKSGSVSCNNGLLNIRGNYSMENTTVNNIGEVEYNSCYAQLSMLNQHDKVNITGNFTTHNIRDTYYVNLKYGTLSVGGNIWSDGQIYSYSGFGSKVVLNGNKKQSVTLASSDKFNILVLTQPISNYTFKPDKCWNTLITIEAGSGDANGDGEFTIADVVLLQKWLLTETNAYLPYWQAVDLYEDGKLDVFDLIMMKSRLIYAE